MQNFNLPSSLFFFQDRKQYYNPNVSLSIEVISEKNKNWTLEHNSPEISNVHALVLWELLLGMVVICSHLNNQEDKQNNQNKKLNISTTHRNECPEWNI